MLLTRQRTIVEWVPETCRHLEAMIIPVQLRRLALLPLALRHMRDSALAQSGLAHEERGHNTKNVRVAVERVKEWVRIVRVGEVGLVPARRRRMACGGLRELCRVSVHPLLINKGAHCSGIFERHRVANHQIPSQIEEKLFGFRQQRSGLWQVCHAQRLPVWWGY